MASETKNSEIDFFPAKYFNYEKVINLTLKEGVAHWKKSGGTKKKGTYKPRYEFYFFLKKLHIYLE